MKRNLALFFFSILAAISYSHDELSEQVKAVTLKIRKNPGNAELYFQRAELYRADSHWKQAEEDYKRARKLAPDLAMVHLGLGLLYLNTERYEASKAALEKFLQKIPNHAEGRVSLGHVLKNLGQRSRAVQEYTMALELKPDPEIYIERSKLEAEEENIEKALAGIDDGIRKLGPIVTLELTAIEFELQRKNYDRALERLQKITDQSDRKETWLARRGDILIQAGRTEEAKAAYSAALKSIEQLPESRKNNRYTKDLEKRINEALSKIR